MVNEYLLYKYLKKTYIENEAYIRYRELEDFEGIFFRQCRFGEFESMIAQIDIEKLTCESVLTMYKNLLVKYFGNNVEIDDLYVLECLRTPQLYDSLYVLNYCFGSVIAINIVSNLEIENQYYKKYINYLGLGNKTSTIDRLKTINIDLNNKESFVKAIKYFKYNLEYFLNKHN